MQNEGACLADAAAVAASLASLHSPPARRLLAAASTYSGPAAVAAVAFACLVVAPAATQAPRLKSESEPAVRVESQARPARRVKRSKPEAQEPSRRLEAQMMERATEAAAACRLQMDD